MLAKLEISIQNQVSEQVGFIPACIDLNEVEGFYANTENLEIIQDETVLCMKSGTEYVCRISFEDFEKLISNRKGSLPMFN